MQIKCNTSNSFTVIIIYHSSSLIINSIICHAEKSSDNSGAVGGAVAGVLVFIAIAVGSVFLVPMVVVCVKRNKKKKLEMMQLDIMAV